MGLNVLFKDGSISEKIMTIIYLTGELPYNTLQYLGKNRLSSQRTVRTLMEKEYIKQEYVYKKRTLLLNTDKQVHYEPFPCALQEYELNVSEIYHKGNSRNSRMRRLRNMLLAKTFAFMLESEVAIVPAYKPSLVNYSISKSDIAFYSAKSIKRQMPHEAKRASSTRAMGVLAFQHKLLMVYHFDKVSQAISMPAERMARAKLETTMNGCSSYYKETSSVALIEDSIILTSGYSKVLHELVTGYRKGTKTPVPFATDNMFTKHYLIPLDREGISLLKMMVLEYGIDILYALPFTEAEINRRGSGQKASDARSEDGTFLLNFLIPDAKKLKRFLNGAHTSARKQTDERFLIHCYDFQVEALKMLKAENVELKVYKMETVYSNFLNAHRSLEERR